MTPHQIRQFAGELHDNLTQNILPYWTGKMLDSKGGYYGRRDGCDRLHPDAPRGAILNARILWTLAAAARHTGSDHYRRTAHDQMQYVVDHFIDREYGGVYWSINPDGTPLDTKKQFYAIAFTIYGLAEYARLTSSRQAIDEAVALFRCIETHSRDFCHGGYLEAATRTWEPIADMRLSDKDLNSSKTMNTHLHILEAYACLLRVWPTDECREATASLLHLFCDSIVDAASGHLGLFFDDSMRRVDTDISYGHDIEASWLLLEAAQTVGDPQLYDKVHATTRRIAEAALEGRHADGSMDYERHADGHTDAERHWWVQAENVIGQTYLAAFHNMPEQLDRAFETWRYIDSHLVDYAAGEWFWSRKPDGSINTADDKAGFWKCPYHNSRMCIEVIERLNSLNPQISTTQPC